MEASSLSVCEDDGARGKGEFRDLGRSFSFEASSTRTRRVVAAVVVLVALALSLQRQGLHPGITIGSCLLLGGLFALFEMNRSRRRPLDDEVVLAVGPFIDQLDGGAEAGKLREAYSEYFAGRRALNRRPDEAERLLGSACSTFGDFLAREAANKKLAGLLASTLYHRASCRHLIATITEDEVDRRDLVEKAFADLFDFEERHTRWRALVQSAVALRIRCRIQLGDLDRADDDLLLLSDLTGAKDSPPDALAVWEEIAEAFWFKSLDERDDKQRSLLQHRALAHFDSWIERLGPGQLGARVRAARRHSELERHERVVELLDAELRKSPGEARGSLFEANRLLGLAWLKLEEPDKALRCYSVLVSLPDPENPWQKDPTVLGEIGEAERMLEGPVEEEPDEA